VLTLTYAFTKPHLPVSWQWAHVQVIHWVSAWRWSQHCSQNFHTPFLCDLTVDNISYLPGMYECNECDWVAVSITGLDQIR